MAKKSNKTNTQKKSSSLASRKLIVRPVRPDNGYDEAVPVALGAVRRATSPQFNGANSIRIHRREFVGTVSNGAVTGFALTPVSLQTPGYDLNPSVGLMFPWLSHIAPSWERYRFTKLAFEFIPSQSSSTSGRFYAAVDYDYDDSIATSKTLLMGNMTAVECAVWQTSKMVCLPAALNRDMPYRYVSCTSRVAQPEPRTTYAGYLMCAFDTTNANLLMDLWVEYDVEFVTPCNDEEVTQALAFGTGIISVADVTVAQGTGFTGPVLPISVPPGFNTGPVRVLDNTCPLSFVGTLFGAAWAPIARGLDIRKCNGKGNLSLDSGLLVNGVTPATLLGTNLVDVIWGVFDSLGAHLGWAYDPGTGHKSTIGVATQSEVSTASKVVKHLIAFNIENLIEKYAAAAYLIPAVVNSVAALGGGGVKFAFSYTD